MAEIQSNPLQSVFEGLAAKNPQLKELGFESFQADMQDSAKLQSLYDGLSSKNPQLKERGFDGFKADMFGGIQEEQPTEQPLTYMQKELRHRFPENYQDESVVNENLNTEKDGIGTELAQQAKQGTNEIVAAAYGIPGYAYDFVGAGLRGLGLNVPEYKDSGFTKDVNVAGVDINPLSILEKAKDGLLSFAKKNAEKVRQINPDIDRGVVEPIQNGEYAQGIRNLFSSMTQSAPASAAMMLSGGLSTASQVGAGAALFGSQNLNQADQEGDYGKVSRDAVVAISSVTGALESIFETSFGSGAAGKAIAGIIKKDGEKAAAETVKKGFQDNVIKMITENPWMQPFGEAYEEMGTQLAQNAVNKYSGYRPETNLMDGVYDAGIMGFGMGSVHGGMIGAAKKAFGNNSTPEQPGSESTSQPVQGGPASETTQLTVDPRQATEATFRQMGEEFAHKETGLITVVQKQTPGTEENIPMFVVMDAGDGSYLLQDDQGNREWATKEFLGQPQEMSVDDFTAMKMAEFDQNNLQQELLKKNQIKIDGIPYILTGDQTNEGYVAVNPEDGSDMVIPASTIDNIRNSGKQNANIVKQVYGKTNVTGIKNEDGSLTVSDPATEEQANSLKSEVEQATGGKATVQAELIPNKDATAPQSFQLTIIPKVNEPLNNESVTTPPSGDNGLKEEPTEGLFSQPNEKKVITQTIGKDQIDFVENEDFDEVVPTDKMPLEKALPILEKKFKDHPKVVVVADKVQVEVPGKVIKGETKWDDDVVEPSTFKTVIKSIKIVPKEVIARQKQADTEILLDILDEFNATPQSREDNQKASEIEAIAKQLGYQTERNAMNQIRLFDNSGTIERQKVAENKQQISDQQNVENIQTEESSQKNQLQNEKSLESSPVDPNQLGQNANQGENTPQAQQGQGNEKGLEENVNDIAAPPVVGESFTPGDSAPLINETSKIENAIDQAAAEVNTNPTEAEKAAGNYKKGHVKVQGMDITIENPKGSFRRGVDEDGRAWETEMKSHYGYFKQTTGKDGDHIDTFIGDNPESQTVFVVDQNNPKTGAFDESKVMLGYNTPEEAKAAYLANYEPEWKGFGSITPVSVDEFKTWLYDGARQRKPFAEYKSTPEPIIIAKTPVKKSNTITGKAKEVEVVESDIHGLALQYFVNGGTVKPDEVLRMFRDDTNERNFRRSYTSNKEGLTVAQIAHNIWENLPENIQNGLGEMDIYNTVEGVIREYNTPTLMAQALLKKYSLDPNQGYSKEWLDAQIKKEDEERQSELESWVNYLSELEINGQLPTENELIELFLPENTQENGQEIDSKGSNGINRPVNPEGNGSVGENLQGSEQGIQGKVEGEVGKKVKPFILKVLEEGKKAVEGKKQADISKAISSSSRFRPFETVNFETPIIGPSGAKLVSYEWKYTWEMKDGKDEGTIAGRVSDWTQAEQNVETGRGIVHQFIVEMPDGTSKTVSSESVLNLLGYTDRIPMKSFPSLVNTVKTLAKQQMQLALLKDQLSTIRKAEQEIDKLPLPKIERSDSPMGAGDIQWIMGDARVAGRSTEYNWNTKKEEPVIDIPEERKETLIQSWKDKRLKEVGLDIFKGNSTQYKITELENRIKRQQRKVDEITKQQNNPSIQEEAPKNDQKKPLLDVLKEKKEVVEVKRKYIIPESFNIQSFDDYVKALNNGEISIDQFKQAYQSIKSSKENLISELNSKTKAELLANMNAMGQYRYKNEKKDSIVRALFDDMLMEFSFGSITFDYGKTLEQSIDDKVSKTTQEDIDNHVAEVKKQREEYASKVQQYKKALSNPETLEEFKIFIKKNGIAKLTPEQKAVYDDLVTDKVLDERNENAERKAVVEKVDTGEVEFSIVETKHTKTGQQLFVVKQSARVSDETYKELSAKAKKLGGYYSSYSKGGAIPGYIFKTREAAEQFANINKENAISTTTETKEEETTVKTVSKLRDNAQKMMDKANEELGRNRLTNTAKRAREAASTEAKWEEEKRIAQTMLNIADAIENGDVKLLDGIKAKTHIQLLDELIRTAKYHEISAKANGSYSERQKYEGEPATLETIEYLKNGFLPNFYASTLKDLINKAEDIKGVKNIAAKWKKKVYGTGEYDQYQTRSTEEVDDISQMFNALPEKDRKYNRIGDILADFKRLVAMGIENDSMLRAALREYIQYRGKKQAPDKIKQLERAIVGRAKNLGIDFFPTPSETAKRMVDIAEINENMDVLEPSAGNGNIADQIKAAGVMPDVIEISSELAEILKAKGYNHIADDFLTFNDKKYDRILMNPPFSNGLDGEHLQHAYDLLKPGGKVIAIIGEGTFIRSDKKAVAFREWLDEVGGTETKLEAGTFQDKTLLNTTGASARLVVIEKEGEFVEEPEPLSKEAMDVIDDIVEKIAEAKKDEQIQFEEEARASEPINDIQDFGEKIGAARKDLGITRTAKETDSMPAWRRKFQFANPDGSVLLVGKVDTTKPFIVNWWEEVKGGLIGGSRQHFVTEIKDGYLTRTPMIFTSEQDAENYIPIYEAKRQGFKIYKNKEGKFVIYKRASNNKALEFDSFDTQEEAETYLQSTEGATSLLNRKRETFNIPQLEKVQRTGKDYRKGRNIDADEFTKTFGFRGGEFGNWVKPEERQTMLNLAYDSFMDLANILNISPRAISLGGELSIAFGARGTGGFEAFNAHYESSRAVINLTRLKGAGAVAHEWMHALDNYFGLQDAKRDYSRDEKGELKTKEAFLSEIDTYKSGMRKELKDIFRAILSRISKKDVTRLMAVDVRQKNFDGFETSIKREADFLLTKLENGSRQYKYNRKTKQREEVLVKATSEQLEQVKKLIKKITSGESTRPEWKSITGNMLGEYSYVNEDIRAIDEIYKAVFGHTGLKRNSGGYYNLGYYAEKLYYAKEQLEKAKSGELETVRIKTELLENSEKFDASRVSPYFSKPLEMLARSFEQFIVTKLNEQGVRSDYLQYDKSPIYKAMYEISPYPDGQDLTDLNQLFQQFFDTIQEKEENGNTVMFRIIGETGAANLDKAEEATTRLDNLAIAREMEQAGKDAKSIRLATGWEKGVDGKWRYEVPDIELSENYQDAETLDQAVNDPELFKAYPALKNIRIGALSAEEEKSSGSYYSSGVDGLPTIYAGASNESNLKSVLLHEIQHYIQDVEGFAQGGNLLSAKASLTTEEQIKVAELQKTIDDLKELMNDSEFGTRTRRDATGAYLEARTEIMKYHPRVRYNRLAGEVESRNVQTRMNMTPEERLNTLLSETEDVSREDQIVLMDGLGVSNLENNAGFMDHQNIVDQLESTAKEKDQVIIDDNEGLALQLAGKIPQKNLDEIRNEGASIKGFELFGKIFVNNAIQTSEVIKTWVHEKTHRQLKRIFPDKQRRNKFLKAVFDRVGEQEINNTLPEIYLNDSEEQRAEEYLCFKVEELGTTGDVVADAETKKLIFDLLNRFTTIKNIQDVANNINMAKQRSGGRNAHENGGFGRRLSENGGTGQDGEVNFNRGIRQDDGRKETRQVDRSLPLLDVLSQAKEKVLAKNVIPETITVGGVERPTRNSKGQFIHTTKEGIENFWKWFGDSKVVDSEGRPLVVYHGTTKNFDEFKSSKFTTAGYFADDPMFSNRFAEGAMGYMNGSPSILPTYLSIQNPLDLLQIKDGYVDISPKEFISFMPFETTDDFKSMVYGFFSGTEQPLFSYLGKSKFTEYIKSLGFDGVLFNETSPESFNEFTEDKITSGKAYIAFESNQIKSATGNNGSFNPDDNNINFKRTKPESLDTFLANAAEQYKEKQKTRRNFAEVKEKVREFIQDHDLPIRRLEEKVKELGGTIKDNMKPYRDMSNSYGRNETLYKNFSKDKMEPVIKTISKIIKSGVSGIEVLPYMISKHAIERNAYMREKEFKEWEENAKAELQKWTDANIDIPQATKDRKEKEFNDEAQAKRAELQKKDYSGVKGFDPEKRFENPDELAQSIVDEFEDKVPVGLVDELWENVKEASSDIVNFWKAGQTMSAEQAEITKNRFKYFIPLRGWREGAAKQLAYKKGEGFAGSLQRAKGRTSFAENPLAYLQQTAFKAIGEQVDNEVKTSMLNLVTGNYDAEFQKFYHLKKAYYVKVNLPDGSFEWEMTMDRPSEEMFASGDAKTKIYEQYQKLRTPSQAHEHEIYVKRPNGDMIIVMSDEMLPVAQAMNHKNTMYRNLFTGQINDAEFWNKPLSATIGTLNNSLKAMYTAWNVVFPLTNFARDIQEASITQFIKGDSGHMVLANYKNALPAIIRDLRGKTPTGKYGMMLQEFRAVGGNTGYTHLKTPEQLEKEINSELNIINRKGTFRGYTLDQLIKVKGAIEAWNQVFEDATRFSVYITSRENGKSMGDAASDAKEASVNFNRKGKSSKAFDSVWAFWNVAIQSMQKNFKLAKDHPGRFGIVAGSWLALGFLEAMLNDMAGGDDDKDYYNISDYVRENYLIIPNIPALIAGRKSDKYLRIPLSQFWRGFKSAGSIAYDVYNGKMDALTASGKAISNFLGGLLPVDVGGFVQDGEFSISPVVPTIYRTINEIDNNRDYMGFTIAKEPFTKEQEARLADSGLGKDNVNPAIKFCTDWLFRAGGGDNENRFYSKNGVIKEVPGFLDINPSYVEHLITGYTGGTGRFIDDVLTTAMQAVIPDQEVDFKNAPFLNSFFKKIPEAKWKIIGEYYDMKSDGNESKFDALKNSYFNQEDKTKFLELAPSGYYNEYNATLDAYDEMLTEKMKFMDYKTAEGSEEVTNTMKDAIKALKQVKQKYNRK